MGFISNLFAPKSTQQAQQQGTSTTSNNAWGAVQPYMNQYLQQFSAGNIAGAQTPVTPYQYAAADSQMGTAANLTPAFATAGDVASSGISPAKISGYMSPYISNVVDATRNDFNTQNARANAGVQAQAAKMGALTGTQSAVAKNLAMESQRRQQDPIIASLYNQGYGQAANLAQADTNARLAGAGAIGNLTGVQTGANTALSGIGSNIWQNQYQNTLTPFNLTTQGAAGLSPFLNAAGTTTNSSGSSTGTTTQAPGAIQSLMGLAGLGLSGYDYGVGKGWFADGGRVGYAEGGSVIKPFEGASEPFHAKMEKAFHTIQRLKEYAKGGPVSSRYADGGAIGPWETTVERAPAEPTPEAQFGKRLESIGTAMTPYRASGDDVGGVGSLTRFMEGVRSANIPRYAGGGFIDPNDNDPAITPYGAEPSAPPSYLGRGTQPPSSSVQPREPMSTVRPMSPEAQFASVLLSGSPIAGSGQAMRDLQQQRIQEEENKRNNALAQARYALEAARNPHLIEQLKAHSIGGQKELKSYEYTMQKDLEAIKSLREIEKGIDDAVMYGVITQDEANMRRQAARDQYQQNRGLIQGVKTPPKAMPTSPPGAVREWVPGKGLQ